MCMSTTRCWTCYTKSLRRCCRTGVVASRSSRPWGQLHRLHRQCLCGSIIPAIGLWGYVSDLQLIVTTLLLDRSWAIQGCVSNNFFVICTEPQQICTWKLLYMHTQPQLFINALTPISTCTDSENLNEINMMKTLNNKVNPNSHDQRVMGIDLLPPSHSQGINSYSYESSYLKPITIPRHQD
jgi:hypothetical protein